MSQADSSDQELQHRVAQVEARMKLNESQLMHERARLAGLERLRWAGSVGDADVEVKGLGNVTVTTDAVTGEIVVTTSDATIHIRPSDLAGTPQPAKPAKPPKAPKH